MNIRLSISAAARDDVQALDRLRKQCRIADGGWSTDLILDGCVLTAHLAGELAALAALDLDRAELTSVLVAPRWRRLGVGGRMVTAIEQLAIRFGMQELRAHAPENTLPFFRACGYRHAGAHGPGSVVEPSTILLHRRFARRQTRYGRRIAKLLHDTGLPADYGRRHRLKLQDECAELVLVGKGVNGREQYLAPRVARSWHTVRQVSGEDGVQLQIASAYRSVDYQLGIIERKLKTGQDLEQILEVSAAPGFSEHHTGHAIDFATPGSPPLENDFENTLAFEWLAANAHRFGFRLSYPRNNRHGIAYEPWHWFFTG